MVFSDGLAIRPKAFLSFQAPINPARALIFFFIGAMIMFYGRIVYKRGEAMLIGSTNSQPIGQQAQEKKKSPPSKSTPSQESLLRGYFKARGITILDLRVRKAL